jgi:hypothetical protein
MTMERERLRDTAKMTLLCVIFLILIRWLTRQGVNLFDLREYVFFAAGVAVASYALWPRSKGRRG